MDERLYEVGRALASRERLAVLRVLAEGNASAGELVARTGDPDVLRHVDALSTAGLVVAGIGGSYGLASLEVLALVGALESVARCREEP